MDPAPCRDKEWYGGHWNPQDGWKSEVFQTIVFNWWCLLQWRAWTNTFDLILNKCYSPLFKVRRKQRLVEWLPSEHKAATEATDEPTLWRPRQLWRPPWRPHQHQQDRRNDRKWFSKNCGRFLLHKRLQHGQSRSIILFFSGGGFRWFHYQCALWTHKNLC